MIKTFFILSTCLLKAWRKFYSKYSSVTVNESHHGARFAANHVASRLHRILILLRDKVRLPSVCVCVSPV